MCSIVTELEMPRRRPPVEHLYVDASGLLRTGFNFNDESMKTHILNSPVSLGKEANNCYNPAANQTLL